MPRNKQLFRWIRVGGNYLLVPTLEKAMVCLCAADHCLTMQIMQVAAMHSISALYVSGPDRHLETCQAL